MISLNETQTTAGVHTFYGPESIVAKVRKPRHSQYERYSTFMNFTSSQICWPEERIALKLLIEYSGKIGSYRIIVVVESYLFTERLFPHLQVLSPCLKC